MCVGLLLLLPLLCLGGAQALEPGQSLQIWTCEDIPAQKFTWTNDSSAGNLALRIVVAGASASESEAPELLVWEAYASASKLAPNGRPSWGIHLANFVNKSADQAQMFEYAALTSTIKSVLYPTLCVSIESNPGIPGDAVVLVQCSASSPSQRFSIASNHITFGGGASLCVDVGTTASCSDPPFNTYPYCDPNASPEHRARDLADRLSAADLAALLSTDVRGSNAGVPRLGVPPVRFGEALHGMSLGICKPYTNASTGFVSTGCPTSFPMALVLGASFNRSLWRQVGSAIGDEGRAFYNLDHRSTYIITWAPDINPITDPRWGRSLEVAGEDAQCLMAAFIEQYANGMQGGEDSRFVKVVSTAKHFSAYNLEHSPAADGVMYTRHNFTAVITRKDGVEFYWPPFQSAVQRGRVGSIMCSINSILVCDDPQHCNFTDVNGTGIPACGDGDLQNNMMRGSWGAGDDLFIVSDCGTIADFYGGHHYCANAVEAAAIAMNAGTDVNCGPTYGSSLVAAIDAGAVALEQAQLSAYRLLRVAFTTGFLTPNGTTAYDSYGLEKIDSPYHRQLAFEAAQQGQVLLRNRNTTTPWSANAPLLPLQAKALRSVALVGPNANVTVPLLGSYFGTNHLVESQSLLQALQRRAAATSNFQINYAVGCTEGGITCNSTAGFAEAVAGVEQSDVAIVVVGLCSTGCPLNIRVEGEGDDLVNLDLPGYQEDLVKAVVATGKPTVVVLVHGAALSIEWTLSTVPAVLDSHYSGELAGDAIISVLFGDYSPSGRSTTTFYPADFITQRPVTDMRLAPHDSAPGLTYLYYNGPALVPFGWGLSYTTFVYRWLNSSHNDREMLASALSASPPAFAVNITNTGSTASGVVALAFISSGIPGEPLQKLFDFQRAARVEPGETVTLHFTLPPAIAATVGMRGERVVRPGAYSIRIGDELSTGNYAACRLTVGGDPVLLKP